MMNPGVIGGWFIGEFQHRYHVIASLNADFRAFVKP
jgi:hypothetical protein